jgi:hypothetical protein
MSDDRSVYPLPPPTSDVGGPDGHSYGAVLVGDDGLADGELRGLLAAIRFSGWIAPPRDGWIVLLGDPGDGVVADDRRGIIEVAAMIAGRAAGAVLALRVRHDRQLALVAWRRGEEVARYCSDPSREVNLGPEVLTDPIGAEYAAVFAELWGRPDAAEDLAELLDEQLDEESVYESERLGKTLRLLGLPAWIVAAGSLPRAMPTGPRPSELIRLRAGLPGTAGRVRDAAIRPLRRRRTPPPVIEDPPQGGGMGMEPWMF